ncbi:hypothetical protein [Halodesulfurarchaeum sp.]|uniref:hypothetical protein n=1 Tax=Halodesulfurarchaeum sp. TaxID=1980530 RepID=UPI002FC32498
MPKTPNHGYNVPAEGEQDWHVPLNENFEQYDTDIEIRDVSDNVGEYEPARGAKFFATDTGLVLLGDGSQWNAVNTTGPVATFEQLVVDDRSPYLILKNQGDDLMELMGEVSGDYGEVRLRVRKLTGGAVPVFTASTDGWIDIGDVLDIGVEDSIPVDIAGRNNWNLNETEGDVRIGDEDYRLTMGVALGGGGAGACNIRAKGGIKRLNLGAGTSGHTVQIDPDKVSIDGDLDVTGNKNFTQTVDTDDGEREVVYTASEAGTPHTETSGVAELEDGRAEVDLPEHFVWVTSDEEPLHVQTTPHSADSGGLAVVERSTEQLVAEDLDGDGDYDFSYTVKGTRKGQADKQVVREPSTGTTDGASPAPADD